MSEHEKAIAKKMADAIKALPDRKKEYFLGFADGVEAMSKHQDEETPTPAGEKERR